MANIQGLDAIVITCGGCGSQAAMQAWATIPRYGGEAFLQCPGCQELNVITTRAEHYPPILPSRNISALPKDIGNAWREARGSFAVGAYTASEIMCRKILMHLAVDVVKSEAGKSFVQYVNDLDSEGYITRGLKPVIDQIRGRGNIANHEIPASTRAEAEQTIKIVEYLLHSIYELPNLATT